MIKELSLDETWEKCLKMWKWISERWDGEMNIAVMKMEYLEKHEPDIGHIPSLCFFCAVATNCGNCPGALVEESFNCKSIGYNYKFKPKKFYQKLLKLNAIRLGKERIAKKVLVDFENICREEDDEDDNV